MHGFFSFQSHLGDRRTSLKSQWRTTSFWCGWLHVHFHWGRRTGWGSLWQVWKCSEQVSWVDLGSCPLRVSPWDVFAEMESPERQTQIMYGKT